MCTVTGDHRRAPRGHDFPPRIARIYSTYAQSWTRVHESSPYIVWQIWFPASSRLSHNSFAHIRVYMDQYPLADSGSFSNQSRPFQLYGSLSLSISPAKLTCIASLLKLSHSLFDHPLLNCTVFTMCSGYSWSNDPRFQPSRKFFHSKLRPACTYPNYYVNSSLGSRSS